MKGFKIAVGIVFVALAMAVPLCVHHRAAADSERQKTAVHEQLVLIAKLSAENDKLRKSPTPAKDANPLTEDEHLELLKLRNELGTLRQTTNEEVRVQAEMQRIRDILKKNENGWSQPPALVLYADELPARSNRVAQLRQWLQGRPEETIPELQFITESNWLRMAYRDLFTDDEYRQWMETMRTFGVTLFAQQALSAVKKYAAANDGRFPAEVSQIGSYFDPPVGDDMLQRYEVVPAKSLASLGSNWSGGDWVITEKSPENNRRIERVVVGSSQTQRILKPVPQN